MPDDSQVISLSEERTRREIDRLQSAVSLGSSQAGNLGMRASSLASQAATRNLGMHPYDTTPLLLQHADVRPRGLVEGFVKTCQRWMLDRRAQAVLLGYKGNEVSALAILSGRIKLPSQDVRDRMALVLKISLILGSLFDEKPAPEIQWLKAPRRHLGGRSALDSLLEGGMTDLLAVYEMAQAEQEP